MARPADPDHPREPGPDRSAKDEQRRALPAFRRALKRDRLPGHVPPRLAAALSWMRAASERAGRVLEPPAHRAAAPVRWALAPVKRYIAEAEAPPDPTAPASVPATLLMRRSRSDRRLHAAIAGTQPAKRNVVGVNGTLSVSEDGVAWEPGRAARLLGAETVAVAWPSVWNAIFAPAERGIPTRIVVVETAAGGFEMQVSDRAFERVAAALRNFGP